MSRYSLNGDRKRNRFSFLRVFLEIPVIVLSIYIAFVVDEWSKEKAAAVQEKSYLEQLLEETRINSEELKADQGQRRIQLVFLDKLLETSNRRVDPDTLRTAIDYLLMVRLYSSTDAVYEDLVSSGNLRLISSDSIRYEMMQYRRKLSRAPITEQSDIDLIENRIEPYLVSKQVLSLLEPHDDLPSINISEQQKDRIIRVLLNDRTFIDLVYLRRDRIKQVIWFETPMEWSLRNMRNLIAAELETSAN
ncbi:MAG: hypothetical protein HEP71_24435 [Roseivirga sp.]|nr:hypothetical protein [Roseivirga sp.]